MAIPRLLLAALAATLMTTGCTNPFAWIDDHYRPQDRLADGSDRETAMWAEIGHQAGIFMREHPGQPLPWDLQPPAPLGITDCSSSFVYRNTLETTCDSY